MSRHVLMLAVLLAGGVAWQPAARAHDFEFRDSGRTRSSAAFEEAIELEPPRSKSRMALYSYVAAAQLWTQPKLRVCFWDRGQDALKLRIAKVADELTRALPVKFVWQDNGQFIDCGSAPRSTFAARVSLIADSNRLSPGDNSASFFAVVGKAGRNDDRLATVNLPFTSNPSEALLRSRVLHEFCHVLGCLHEHQRGLCSASFNEPAIRARYGLSEAAYRQNYLDPPDSSMAAAEYGPFDTESIMMYRFDPALFLPSPAPRSKCLRDSDITDLSPGDANGLAWIYSKKTRTFADLSIDELLAREPLLRAEAQTLRSKATDLRLYAVRKDKSLFQAFGEILSIFEPSAVERATTFETRATALEDEAESYAFRPETVAKLRLAKALLAEEAAPD